jgi:hypothetical protein
LGFGLDEGGLRGLSEKPLARGENDPTVKTDDILGCDIYFQSSCGTDEEDGSRRCCREVSVTIC